MIVVLGINKFAAPRTRGTPIYSKGFEIGSKGLSYAVLPIRR